MEKEINNKPVYFVYSVFDKAIETFGIPFFEVNDKCAFRRVKAAYRDNPFVDDLLLYQVGFFDTGKGEFSYTKDTPRFVFNISDFYEGVTNE